jgi:hypothetical protein
MHVKAFVLIATAMSGVALLTPATSQACGGCFGPPSALTTVTGHRMAFAVSDERTVLWDQFSYTGAPEDFSWVLPVLPGAYLEESTDAWFEALETVTQTVVTAPAVRCAQSDGGCTLGASAAGADLASAQGGRGYFDGNSVTVLHQGTVGPYETVTLRSKDGDALTAWLTGHGYFIPPEIEPTIADYTSQGDDFVALRLQPGVSVQQMTPVRVVTPGGEYLLPLRMVAAGVAEKVNIVLYVIGEQRYAMPDLHEVSIDTARLKWTFADNSNNYDELHRQALAKNLGFSYLPSFAMQGAFSRPLPGPNGGTASFSLGSSNVGSSFRVYSTLSDLYFAQAQSNDGLPLNDCSGVRDRLSATRLVTADASQDTIAAGTLECDGYTDISAAMLGMRPANVWLTRLELDLPKEALSMDCTVVPADSQTPVSNQVQAVQAADRPAGCDEVVFESKLARGLPGRGGVLAFLTLAGSLLWLRRRGARC